MSGVRAESFYAIVGAATIRLVLAAPYVRKKVKRQNSYVKELRQHNPSRLLRTPFQMAPALVTDSADAVEVRTRLATIIVLGTHSTKPFASTRRRRGRRLLGRFRGDANSTLALVVRTTLIRGARVSLCLATDWRRSLCPQRFRKCKHKCQTKKDSYVRFRKAPTLIGGLVILTSSPSSSSGLNGLVSSAVTTKPVGMRKTRRIFVIFILRLVRTSSRQLSK